jgi:hypothetical protein
MAWEIVTTTKWTTIKESVASLFNYAPVLVVRGVVTIIGTRPETWRPVGQVSVKVALTVDRCRLPLIPSQNCYESRE